MSVIAAKIKDGQIDVASDSIIAKDDLKRNNFKKIFRTPSMIFGGCGSAEELSIFFDYAKESDFVITDTQSLRDFLLEFSNVKEAYTGDRKIENAYIIAIKDQTGNKLFEVDGMFITEVTDYTAIGQGEAYALAALALNHSVEEAVKVAATFCCYVSEPVNVFHID